MLIQNKAIPESLQSCINEFHYRNPQEELPERLWNIAINVIGSKEMDNKTNIERADVLSFFKDTYLLTKVTARFYIPEDDIDNNEV